MPPPPPRSRRLDRALAAAVGLCLAALAVAPLDHGLAPRLAFDAHAGPIAGGLAALGAVLRLFGKADVLALLCALHALGGGRRRASRALLALLIAGAIAVPLKALTARERPLGGRHDSFPSGDVASITAVAGGVGAPLPAALAVLAIAVQRLGESRHFPSDVLAGAALGLAAAALARRLAARRIRRRAGPAAFAVLALALVGWRAAPFATDELGGREFLTFLATFGPAAGLVLARRALRRPRLAGVFARAVRRAAPAATPAILAAGLAAMLVPAARAPLLDRDEPRFALASLEMARGGGLLVPTNLGRPRLEKPPLAYWAMAPLVRALGPREWVFRLPAIAAALLAAAALAALARRLGVPRAGPWAAALLLTAPLAWPSASAATADALLVAAVTGAALAALVLRDAARPALPALALAICLGAGLLAKGPVALLFALPVVFVARRGAWSALALAGGATLFAAWAIPANAATGGALARVGLGIETWGRIAAASEHHGGLAVAPVYYPLAVALGFFPWIAFLPAALRRALPGRALLAAWFVVPAAALSLVATKLPHYLLPAFPALALAAALALTGAPDRRRLALGAALLWPCGVALALALVASFWFVPHAPLRAAGLPAGALLLAALPLAARDLAAGRARAAAATLGVAMALVHALLAHGVIALVAPLAPGPRVAAALADAQLPVDAPLALAGPLEPSIAFYLARDGRAPRPLGEAGIVLFLAGPAPRAAIGRVPQVDNLDGWRIATIDAALDPARGSAAPVTVAIRPRLVP